MNSNRAINRRGAVMRISASAAALATFPNALPAPAEDSPRRTSMGLVVYCRGIRRSWLRQRDPEFDLFEPLTFLKHCHQLGAGGIQVSLGTPDAGTAGSLRTFAEQHDLFIEAIVNPPRNRMDLDRFTAEIRTAAEVGVAAARTVVIPGRRYEQFSTLAEFREAELNARRMLELAAPVVEKHRVPLAVENHKDQRIDERLALFKHLNSEFIGACVDTGNSFALLDDPHEVIEALAPHAFSVHLKDQAVREYEDGFLLGDIPLGEGCFDLNRMVETLRRAHPKIRFLLELITRDPLPIPCLTERFWATMPDVPAVDLARSLRFVRRHSAPPLQQVASLSLEQQVALEDANLRKSLDYAQRHLEL
jgi:3-oxoisoapionate decarboxylase